MITVEKLNKHFKVRKHHEGPNAALRNLITQEVTVVKAVDEISFHIPKGELVGYLGPNGAGKSTTLKMLTGLLVPSGGHIDVNGFLPWKDRQRYVSRIGAVFGQRSTLWWDLPVVQSLELLQHIYKIPNDVFISNFEEFKNLLDLEPFLGTPVRSLSLGQRMRADICAALMHNPDILFLDEPTIGLDVVAKERIREFIAHINKDRGTTVVLTTHDLADVQKLCQRVMIIDHGQLLFDGQLDNLQNRFGSKRQLTVDFSESYEDVSIEGAEVINHDGRQASYAFSKQELSASELIGRLSSKFSISDLTVLEPDIEETIRRIYEHKLLEN